MLKSADHLQSELRTADNFLRQRNVSAAKNICADLVRAYPQAIEPHLLMARAEQMQNSFGRMLDEAQLALAIDPAHPQAILIEIEALITLGHINKASSKIEILVNEGRSGAMFLARLAEMQTQIGDHQGALTSLLMAGRQFAADQKPNPTYLYNLSSAHIAVGNLDVAEALLDQLIASHPHDYDAYYNRATLRKQTAENNHVDALNAALSAGPRHAMGEVQLRYALAKELEDLGQFSESFKHLAEGAKLRRNNMSYRVDDDIETMQIIQSVFGRDFADNSYSGHDKATPIFVVGLPRSGTTLVDRILCSHPNIESAGEVNDLAVTITRLCGAVSSKTELVKKSATLDFVQLGQAYETSMRERMPEPQEQETEQKETRHIIDKTPLNFLYIGLIAKAFPNASIIHVKRDDMDVGYAMLKTLFRMGYPFSYDQIDLARYINAKNIMMAHWQDILPGRIHTVNYEDLITDQEGESRALIAATGLAWDPACLDFHKNKSASATASAAQIRQPIYASSVAKWKAYETELMPLYTALRNLGTS